MADKQKKIMIFGTGDFYQRYKSWLKEHEIIALLDNNPSKQGIYLDGCQVMPPERGVELEYDFIVILSIHDKEMREQLLSLGVSNEKIYNQNDLYLFHTGEDKSRTLIFYQGDAEYNYSYKNFLGIVSDKIVLFSNDLHINGASMALVNVAVVLSAFHDVFVVTSEDGPCREILCKKGIAVIVDKNISVLSMSQMPWLKDAKLIFCNTVNFYRLLEKRYLDIPVVWWLHEPAFFYEGLDGDILKSIPQENMTILAVSKIAQSAYKEYYPQALINILPVYVDDVAVENHEEHKKITFAVIGYVRPWKGQDIFIEAAKKIQDYYENVDFLIIGDDSSHFAQSLKTVANNKIIFTGELSPTQLNETYKDIDILVCPSRIESLSIVVIEAMLRGIPSIVSSSAGVSEYIADGVNGWVFRSEDSDELKTKMLFTIENREEAIQVGKRSMEIYKNHFTKDVFTERLLKIINSHS